MEEGAGKGIVDKSSTATTAIAQREAIRKSEKRKRALANDGGGILSSVKHKDKVSRPRATPAKRVKSPLASKSTRVRLMLSPRVIAPSTTLARSSQESPMSPFINKRDHEKSLNRKCGLSW